MTLRLADHHHTADVPLRLSLGHRARIYVGLAADPREGHDPVHVMRPTCAPASWIVGIPALAILIAVERHGHGIGWASIIATAEVALFGSVLGGLLLILVAQWIRFRRKPLDARLAAIAASAGLVKPSYLARYGIWVLAIFAVAINPQSRFGIAALVGLILGVRLGRDLVHWRIERQVGAKLFVPTDGTGGRHLYRLTAPER